MAGSVRITGVNANIPVVVDLNTTGTPTEFAAFSNQACTASVSLPATITVDTTFYVKATGPVVLSVKVAGAEIGPGQVYLSNTGPVSFAVNSNPDRLIGLEAARLGASVAATTPGTVVGKVQLFDSAGVSAGYLPVYDAIT